MTLVFLSNVEASVWKFLLIFEVLDLCRFDVEFGASIPRERGRSRGSRVGHVRGRRVPPGRTSLITAEKRHRFTYHGGETTPVRGPDSATRALSHERACFAQCISLQCHMVDGPEAVAWGMSIAAEYRQVPPCSSLLLSVYVYR